MAGWRLRSGCLCRKAYKRPSKGSTCRSPRFHQPLEASALRTWLGRYTCVRSTQRTRRALRLASRRSARQTPAQHPRRTACTVPPQRPPPPKRLRPCLWSPVAFDHFPSIWLYLALIVPLGGYSEERSRRGLRSGTAAHEHGHYIHHCRYWIDSLPPDRVAVTRNCVLAPVMMARKRFWYFRPCHSVSEDSKPCADSRSRNSSTLPASRYEVRMSACASARASAIFSFRLTCVEPLPGFQASVLAVMTSVSFMGHSFHSVVGTDRTPAGSEERASLRSGLVVSVPCGGWSSAEDSL